MWKFNPVGMMLWVGLGLMAYLEYGLWGVAATLVVCGMANAIVSRL